MSLCLNWANVAAQYQADEIMDQQQDIKQPEGHRIYDELRFPILTVKVFLQILIGAGVIIAVIVNVAAMIGFIDIGSEEETVQWVRFAAEAHPLRIAAYALACSGALELGFMLFTPGPDEAVEPLMLGISASALFYISALIEKSETQWHNFLLLTVILAGIPLMFWVRERFIHGIVRSKTSGK